MKNHFPKPSLVPQPRGASGTRPVEFCTL